MATDDIICEVSLRYRDVNKLSCGSDSDKLPDFYMIMIGEKNVTRKILLNMFELRSNKNSDAFNERFFEFHCRDIGKITNLNVSIDSDDKPEKSVYIDFIGVKLKDKSEAYK